MNDESTPRQPCPWSLPRSRQPRCSGCSAWRTTSPSSPRRQRVRRLRVA